MAGFWEEDVSSYIRICDKEYSKSRELYRQRNITINTVSEKNNPSERKTLITININSKDEEWTRLSLGERKNAIQERVKAICDEFEKADDNLSDSGKLLKIIGKKMIETEEPYECSVYILTEYLKSFEDIYFIDKKATITIQEVFSIGIQISKVMEELVDLGIYHRGVSPNTILRKNYMDYVLGVIHPQRRGPVQAQEYSYRERSYIAPELFNPSENFDTIHFERINEQTEIYNLGAVLYEILDRKHHLFMEDASDLHEAEIRRLKGEIPNIPDTGTVRLGKCIRKACSPLEIRYTSLKEFREELERIYHTISPDKREETIYESLYDDTSLDQTTDDEKVIMIQTEEETAGSESNGAEIVKSNPNSGTEKKTEPEKQAGKEKEKTKKEKKKRKKVKEEKPPEILSEEELNKKEKRLKLMIAGSLILVVGVILCFVLLNYNGPEREIRSLIQNKNYGTAAEKIADLAGNGKNVDDISKEYIDSCIKNHTTNNIPKVIALLSEDVSDDYYYSLLNQLSEENSQVYYKTLDVIEDKGIDLNDE